MLAECRDLLGIIEASLAVASHSLPFSLWFPHVQSCLRWFFSVMASFVVHGPTGSCLQESQCLCQASKETPKLSGQHSCCLFCLPSPQSTEGEAL